MPSEHSRHAAAAAAWPGDFNRRHSGRQRPAQVPCGPPAWHAAACCRRPRRPVCGAILRPRQRVAACRRWRAPHTGTCAFVTPLHATWKHRQHDKFAAADRSRLGRRWRQRGSQPWSFLIPPLDYSLASRRTPLAPHCQHYSRCPPKPPECTPRCALTTALSSPARRMFSSLVQPPPHNGDPVPFAAVSEWQRLRPPRLPCMPWGRGAAASPPCTASLCHELFAVRGALATSATRLLSPAHGRATSTPAC